MTLAADLREQQFLSALAAADASSREYAGVPLRDRLADVVATLDDSPGLLSVTLALSCVALLLVVRPPFVLNFEHDLRRPWRGRASLCWTSVCAVTALLVGGVAAVPLLAR